MEFKLIKEDTIVKNEYKYNIEVLKILTLISSWTVKGNRPDISNGEKLEIIREELSKLLP